MQNTCTHFCNSAAQLPIPVLIRQRTVTQRWTTPRTVHTSNRIQCANDLPQTIGCSPVMLLMPVV